MTDEIPIASKVIMVGADARMDAWTNAYTMQGIPGRDHTLASTFKRNAELGTEVIHALVEQDGLFARTMECVPEDATRKWISIQGQNSDGTIADDFGRSLLDAMDELEARERLFQAMRLENIEGGSALILGVNDGQDPSEPIAFERITSFDFIHVVQKDEITPGLREDDPTSPNFRQPKDYYLATKASGVIHPSRVITFNGIYATPRTLVERGGWGVSYAERVFSGVKKFGMLWDNVEAVFKDIAQDVLKIKDLTAMLAKPNGKQLVLARLMSLQMMASTYNASVIDKDVEEIEKRPAQLAGVSDLILRVMDYLPAVTGIPLSRLFGQAPSGMSTDDKSGTRVYYDMVANQQRRKLRDPIKRIITCLLAAKNGPTGGQSVDQWDFTFQPLMEPTGKEQADERQVEANTDKIYVEMGAISPEEVRSKLSNDPECPYVIDAGTDEYTGEIPEEQTTGTLEGTQNTGTGIDGKAADTALNGAQVASAVDIVSRVAMGQLPRDTGVNMLVEFFNLEHARAERVMGSVGKGFKIEPTAPPELKPAPTAKSDNPSE